MFSSARIKLTLWYILILALIITLFSGAVYRGFTMEFDRVIRVQRYRQERPVQIFDPLSGQTTTFQPMRIDTTVIDESKDRIRLIIILVDLAVLSASAVAAYFLAGITLSPIEQMVEDQKRFIADASHELRTPLTALKSEVEVALRDKHLNLKGARELLESNLEEVDKLKSLSDYLLDLGKYQGDNLKLNLEKLELSEVIDSSIGRVSALAKAKEIKVLNRAERVSFEGEGKSLTEALVILLDNAIKFSNPGKSIDVQGFKKDGEVVIQVTDRGRGISEKDMPLIFRRFYQADSSRGKGEGYGLGLSIAKRIVELHNGSIMVRSKLGKGSVFSIMIPRSQGFFS